MGSVQEKMLTLFERRSWDRDSIALSPIPLLPRFSVVSDCNGKVEISTLEIEKDMYLVF